MKYYNNPKIVLFIRNLTSRVPRIKGAGIILAYIAKKFIKSSIKVKVKVFENWMELNPSEYISNQLLFVPQWYDRREIKLLKKLVKNGDYVIDVGANIGVYTLLLSRLVGDTGKVLSIEVDKNNFNCLLKNIKINTLNNIILKNVGVSDKYENLCLYLNNNGNLGAHTFMQPKDGSMSYEEHALVPLSVLTEDKCPQFMKIDIEGFEYRVLKQYICDTPLNRQPIYIMLEDEPRHREKDAVDFLVRNKYHVIARYDTNVFLKKNDQ